MLSCFEGEGGVIVVFRVDASACRLQPRFRRVEEMRQLLCRLKYDTSFIRGN